MPSAPNINDDPVAMSHIRQLRALRRSRRLTQDGLAKLIGTISRSVISHAELLDYPVTVSSYNILADFFNWPHYKQPEHDTLTLNFEPATTDNPPAENLIPPSLLPDLKAIAAIKGVSVLDVVTKVLKDYLARYSTALEAVRKIKEDCC